MNPTTAKTTKTTARKTATKTEAVTPNELLVHAVDVGNATIKYIGAGTTEPKAIRSLYVEHTLGMNNKKPGTEDSPVVVLSGKSVHFGNASRKYQQPAQPLAGEDKTRSDIYVHAVLSTFRPLADGSTCYPVHLKLSVPNYERDATHIKDLFEGKRLTTYVNGVELLIDVKQCSVYREGMGSFLLAQKQGKLKPTGGNTLVVDIGGGTVCSLLVDQDGEVIGEPAIFNGAGALQLAASVAGDYRLTSALDGSSANPALVVDAFQAGNVYAASGYDFSEWLPEYVKQWFKGIIGVLTTRYPTSVMASVGTMLFTGGSVHLLPDGLEQTSKLMSVLDEPEFANVRGMAL